MRHHINDIEFTSWRDEFDPDFLFHHSDEYLYDLWVEGYSQWEVEAMLG